MTALDALKAVEDYRVTEVYRLVGDQWVLARQYMEKFRPEERNHTVDTSVSDSNDGASD